MLPALNRLKKADFDSFKKKKKKTFSSGNFSLSLCREGFNPSRFGVVVSFAVARKAAERNKIKRRIRSVLSDKVGKTKEGFAVAVYAKKGAGDLSFGGVKEQIDSLFKKAKILKNND